jgi:hypothetical protein
MTESTKISSLDGVSWWAVILGSVVLIVALVGWLL